MDKEKINYYYQYMERLKRENLLSPLIDYFSMLRMDLVVDLFNHPNELTQEKVMETKNKMMVYLELEGIENAIRKLYAEHYQPKDRRIATKTKKRTIVG